VTELEIDRPGREFDPSQLRTVDLAGRKASEDCRELEPAGVTDSKFGTIALFRGPGRFDPAKSCFGFLSHFDDPTLQIPGRSCEGASLPGTNAAVSPMGHG
jgi:hypothetical protein